jgi:hypothetical protein
MILGMPKGTFWLTVVLSLLALAPTFTDMSDKVRFWWALIVWVALAPSFFFLLLNSQLPWRRVRIAASLLIPVALLVFAFSLLKPQWKKVYPPPVVAPVPGVDEIGRIEQQLGPVQDSTYRQLVAAVIYAFAPQATLSVGSLVHTPDGTRTVDIEVRSSGKSGAPLLAAIDVLDLPSGRKADITAVDAADSKRNDIKVDAMLLCSNTGFEPDAISKAKRKKIGLISVLRQGDERVKAVIEEEIYLRKIKLDPFTITYNGNNLSGGGVPAYGGGSVVDWVEVKADLMAAANPQIDFPVTKVFNFKEPVHFVADGGKQITLTSLSASFTPHVQWLSQTVRLDAKAGIYDYVRGHVRLTPGSNSYTMSGVNFDLARPLSSPPAITELGVGLRPGEFEFALADVSPAPLRGTIIPNLDDQIRSEDLRLKLTDRELSSLKRRAHGGNP